MIKLPACFPNKPPLFGPTFFPFKNMELVKEINYSCNSDMFRIAYYVRVHLNKEERHKIGLWLRKIMKNNRTLADLKLRNEFMRILADQAENGKLETPFDQEPPKTPLKVIAKQLPGYDQENPTQDDDKMAMLRLLPAKYGGFLLPKPLPQIGAYCHLSATSRKGCTVQASAKEP